MRYLDIGDSVTHIGERAFYEGNIQNKIIILNTVKYIGVNAFAENLIPKVELPYRFKDDDKIAFSFDARTKLSFRSKPGKSSISNSSQESDVIIGNLKKNRLKAGKKGPSEMYGMNGNNKFTGGKYDDCLDGGNGNDKLKDKKVADTYVLSSGNDQFLGLKLKEGDSVEIDGSIDFELVAFKKHSKIIHDEGVTIVSKLNVSNLTSIIEIV